MFTVGSLFSGYGGIELGLEQTEGFRTVWHCEIESYPSAILKERWPDVPNLGDITKVAWETIERPDVLCGGFPCQDISQAGKQRGIIKGETRSGLWGEFHKAIRLLRPRFVLIENVSALSGRGLDIVLADLAKIGYDAEWLDIRASDFGAPHKRERLFIVAYPRVGDTKHHGHATAEERESTQEGNDGDSTRQKQASEPARSSNEQEELARSDTDHSGRLHRRTQEQSAKGGEYAQRESVAVCTDVSDTCCERCRRWSKQGCATQERKVLSGEQERREVGCETQRCSHVSNSNCERYEGQRSYRSSKHTKKSRVREAGDFEHEFTTWEVEPDLGRVVDGVARGMDSYLWRERVKALGNGVVPQITRWVGEMILQTAQKYKEKPKDE